MSAPFDDGQGRSPEATAAPPGGALDGFLKRVAREGASDLLLVAGAPPTVYAHGAWAPIGEQPLRPVEIAECLTPVLTERHQAMLRDVQDADFSFAWPGVGRFRANVHYQRGTVAAALRAVPATVPPFEQLQLPPEALRFAEYPSGLVLVTGCTGQGKSTTLAAMIDHLNRHRSAHVVTIEDPIEFEFAHGRCLIEQRQIGEDSPSFASALRHVLRQRPDVILVGEMRDLETVATALTAAETGHLVLASLHTANAVQTLARIIDVFPPVQQAHVRTQLAASLRAILCQILVRDELNESLTPATEVLVADSAIRRALRDNETHLIYSMIETGRRYGMRTMEQSLAELVRSGRVRQEEALAAAPEASRLARVLGGRAEAAGGVPHEAHRVQVLPSQPVR